jgi:hypothetical protein
MKMIAVWNIAPCSLFEVDPMVKPVRISETSVYFSETTRRCILDGCYLRMDKMFPSFQTLVLVMLSLWVLSCELAGWSVTHEARVPVILRTLMIMISLVIINEDIKKRKCIVPNQNTYPTVFVCAFGHWVHCTEKGADVSVRTAAFPCLICQYGLLHSLG